MKYFSFGGYLEAFTLFGGVLTVIYCTYEEVVKRLAKKPAKTAVKLPIRHQNKTSITIAQPVVKKVLYQRFEVEIKGTKVVQELTSENFKELLSEYFIAVEYLFKLWSQHPFHLTINDDLHLHYGRPKDCLGFIKSGEISEIFVLNGVSQKQKTGILIHEIAHDRAFREARANKLKIPAHGKEFKRHLNRLFAPLIINDEYFSKYKDIGKHLRYDARKYSPPMCLCE